MMAARQEKECHAIRSTKSKGKCLGTVLQIRNENLLSMADAIATVNSEESRTLARACNAMQEYQTLDDRLIGLEAQITLEEGPNWPYARVADQTRTVEVEGPEPIVEMLAAREAAETAQRAALAQLSDKLEASRRLDMTKRDSQ